MSWSRPSQFENLGSTLSDQGPSQSQRKSSKSRQNSTGKSTSQKKRATSTSTSLIDGGSDDELDTLSNGSQSESQSASKESGTNLTQYTRTANALSNLKFNKKSKTAEQENTGPAGSTMPRSKTWSSGLPTEKVPSRPLRDKGPSKTDVGTSSQKIPSPPTRTARPRPRPVPRPQAKGRSISDGTPSSGTVAGMKQKQSSKGKSSQTDIEEECPFGAISPVRLDPSSKRHRTPTNEGVISLSTSSESRPPSPGPSKPRLKKKHLVMKPEQILGSSPDLSPLDKASSPPMDPFPDLSPLRKETVTLELEPFPMSPPIGRSSQATSLDKFPMPSPVSMSQKRGIKRRQGKGADQTFDSVHVSPDLDPFPVNLTPRKKRSELRGSSSKKRMSSEYPEGSHDRGKKKFREETSFDSSPDSRNEDIDVYEDSFFLNADVDPKTLCPYCDRPLPVRPSRKLQHLLEVTRTQSRRDPRPSNPLGLKAPLSAFITVCQRHQFETDYLPEAEAKGWPQEIEWGKLEGRVKSMRKGLKAIIDDEAGMEVDTEFDLATPDDQDDGILDLVSEDEDPAYDILSPRARCFFWREIVNAVKAGGAKVITDVRSQFASFDKAHPGYYGELGAVIILQTLYNLFPPTCFNADSIKPLNTSEFIQRVLVPEVALRLIMDDRGLSGRNGARKALKVLRDSAKYGALMFPEDGDTGGTGRKVRGTVQEGMGVADMMVMQRARRRRKELEEEEREEEEAAEQRRKDSEFEISDAQSEREPGRKKKDKAVERAKKNSKGKGKQLQSDTDMEGVEPQRPPRPRPVPRPIVAKRQVPQLDVDADSSLYIHASRSEPTLRSSPTVSDFGKEGIQPRRVRSDSSSSDSDVEVLTNAAATPKPKKQRKGLQSVRPSEYEDDEATPRPSNSQLIIPANIPPLELARARRKQREQRPLNDQWTYNQRSVLHVSSSSGDDSDDLPPRPPPPRQVKQPNRRDPSGDDEDFDLPPRPPPRQPKQQPKRNYFNEPANKWLLETSQDSA